ncbi:MAG: MFS transporter [Paracoccaceae bacterium]
MLTRFIASSGLANLADGIAVVVWAWLASLLTRDPLLIAALPVVLRLPWFLFAIPAGLVTDRVDRRLLILAMDGVRALAFTVVGAAIWLTLPLAPAPETGLAHPGLFAVLALSAVVIGVAEVFRDNAAQTIMPSLVPHERLEAANGRLWSVELVGNALLGPAVGAFLIAAFLPLPFLLNAVAFAVGAWLVLSITGQYRPVQSAQRNWRHEFFEGWNFLKNAPVLKLLAVSTGVWNLLHQMIVIALVLHVQENLGLGAPAYGMILAAGAIGGIAGGVVGVRVVERLGRGRSAQLMTLLSAISFAAIPFAPNAWALAVLFVFSEFTGIIWNTVSVSYRQRIIPDALLGRVNSLYRLLAWGMMPIGLALSGVLTRLAEGPLPRDTALIVPFVVAGLGGILLAAVIWRPIGRAFDQPSSL